MMKSQRLRPMARLARQHERNAARQLGNTIRQIEKQQEQLDDLIIYREKYSKKFKNAGQNGLSAVLMRTYRCFLEHLDEVIAKQKQQIDDSHQTCNQNKVNWKDKYSHSKMIDKAVTNRQRAEIKERDKHAQREQDDRVKTS